MSADNPSLLSLVIKSNFVSPRETVAVEFSLSRLYHEEY